MKNLFNGLFGHNNHDINVDASNANDLVEQNSISDSDDVLIDSYRLSKVITTSSHLK